MKCKECRENCVKNGFQKNGKQKYYCKRCKLHQQESYVCNACNNDINTLICKLLVNGCGITDISRVLNMSKNTVVSRILKINKTVKVPTVSDNQECYEMDELFTRINGKISWLISLASPSM